MIRRANIKDIDRIMELLREVLELHAALRPDIFISGTTKYTGEELKRIISCDLTPVYVAADENDRVEGYVFCQIKEQPSANHMVPFKTVYIDDLCVDEALRGHHIGEQLFEYVKNEAKRLGCYDITLNVWTGNDSAESFYEKMGMKPREKQMEYIL